MEVTEHPSRAEERLLTDGELIAAVQQGDTEAWTILYRRWLPWVWRYAYTLVGDVHSAEDVTSEAMMVWVRHASDTGASAPQLAAWLRRVIRHKAADLYRHGERCRTLMREISLQLTDVGQGGSPSHPLEDAEAEQRLQRALSQLTESQQLLLEWKYNEGLTVNEIADRLGATAKAVEAQLYRARQEVRQFYQDMHHDP